MHAPEVIKEARRRAQMTQEEMARAAGTTQGVISRYESRGAQPSFAMVERLVAAAGLQMEIDLVTRIVPFGAGPIGSALTRRRQEVARLLREEGVLEVEIAGDLAIGDDIPGATLLLLVRTPTPWDWRRRGTVGVRVETEVRCPVAIVDADAVPPRWAEEAAGPRVPFPLADLAGDADEGRSGE